MAKLVLTKKERESATWCELEDESLGKVIKSMMSTITQVSEEQGKLYLLSAAMMLCSATAEANADTSTFTVEGLKNKANDFGNWKVIIKRMAIIYLMQIYPHLDTLGCVSRGVFNRIFLDGKTRVWGNQGAGWVYRAVNGGRIGAWNGLRNILGCMQFGVFPWR